MRYYEDIRCNVLRRYGAYRVTREEVLEFAEKYDPHSFHLSDEAAAKSLFGRLSASGWHTCAMTMRMIVDNMKGDRQESLGSPGVDNIRWLKPVYPGDTLRCEDMVLSKRKSQSRPEMGILKNRVTVYNQDDEPVMSMETNGLIRVRGD